MDMVKKMNDSSIIAEELQKLNRNIDILEPVIFSIEELLKEIVNKNLFEEAGEEDLDNDGFY